jgi:hypothetical protein
VEQKGLNMGEFWRLFGATLLGAIVSFGATFYFEWRKERRTDKKDRQETERQLLQAGRLVYEELNNAWIVLDRTIDTDVWWSSPPYDLDLSAYDTHKATLARLLDKDTWSAVSTAYSGIAEFNKRLAMGREGKEVPSPVLEVEDDSEPMLEPIQGKFTTDAWKLELLYLYEWVDPAMELLAREFLSEGKAKPKVHKQPQTTGKPPGRTPSPSRRRDD